MNHTTHCGYVAIIGRPNVGKSTLLNCMLGQKISITSPKPQTTRNQILGVKTNETTQVVYIDTPGLHDTEQRAMNRYMNRMANSVIFDADVIIFMVEAVYWSHEDDQILERMKEGKAPIILVINKVDALRDKGQLLPFMDKMRAKHDFVNIVPLSAKNADNVSALEDIISTLLPVGPHLFPEGYLTDKSVRFQVSEIIREKIIQGTEQEVPYSSMVEIEEYKVGEKLIEINAIIWVEREGQKAILIGKRGERLKKIGTQARKDIETLVNQKVFLRLWVKVKDSWTDDERALRSLGYE